MDAGMLECPECGAPVPKDAQVCVYCQAHLQTEACTQCYGLNFIGSKHCTHCGAKVFHGAPKESTPGSRQCPRCEAGLSVTAVGESFLEECTTCGGIWVDIESFKKIVTTQSKGAAFTGAGAPGAAPGRAVAAQHDRVKYLHCPDCKQLMNRLNFGRKSGVIVDVCKLHGTWFDRDELRQVVEFIHSGGLDAAREREIEDLRREQERLKAQMRAGEGGVLGGESVGRTRAVAEVASELIKFLLG
jgi:Zn-finger nucleic acid-binding protein